MEREGIMYVIYWKYLDGRQRHIYRQKDMSDSKTGKTCRQTDKTGKTDTDIQIDRQTDKQDRRPDKQV